MSDITTPVPTQLTIYNNIRSITNSLSYPSLLAQLSFWQWTLITLTSIFIWKIITARLLTPLSKMPGPFWETVFSYNMYKSLFQGEFHTYLLNQQHKYGPIFYVARNRVCISDPNDARHILSKKTFIKSKVYNMSILGAPNIFTTKDPKFNEMRRRQIGPAFTVSHISEMEKIIHDQTVVSLKNKIEALLNKNAQQTGVRECRINYVKDFYYMMFDVVSELAFGKSFGMLERGDFTILGYMHSMSFLAATEAAVPFTLEKEWIMKKQRDDARKLVAYTKKIVQDRIRENQEKGKPERKDILQSFIDSVDKETGNKMSIQEIVSENIVLLFGGTDTASNTMSWTLFLLMIYPEVYKKVVQEVREAFPNPKSSIKYSEARSKLPYLEAVLYESMRLLPVVPAGLGRTVPKEGAEFQGYKIPGGTTIYVFIQGLHRNPKYWDQPDKFIPERFLGEGAAERKRNVFIFSTGYRICPGRNLAWMEMMLPMSRLLRDYDFELPKESHFGPDVIDPLTGEPKIMPGHLGLVFGPRYPDRDGWIVIKPADLSAFSIPIDNSNSSSNLEIQSNRAFSNEDKETEGGGGSTPLSAVSTTSTLV
ncbi:hypothetical protein H4219_003646 [Mycoemilia scoparia]|uniref:Cytochrome P450 n=1 Tax=Mycoemilia scoparia TaxID=417184 RepID=A0A9W7ZZL9_9FUNG|nr:hypothetical protein H4219_003646 [Mycoemilia scoparia]